MERNPWECPRCHHVNGPHVDQCPCEPRGGVTAARPAPVPSQPPATVSVTTSPHGFWYGGGGSGSSGPSPGDVVGGPGGGGGNGGAAVTGGEGITVHSHVHLDGKEIFKSVQRQALARQARSGGLRAV